jgi:integrase
MFETLTDAKAALAIARSEKVRGTFVPPAQRRRDAEEAKRLRAQTALTVASWSDTWLKRLEDDGKSPGTVRAHRSLLDRHILPAIGDMPLAEVTEDDIDALVEAIRALPSARNRHATTNGVWANAARTLRALFNAAVAAHAGGLEATPVHVRVPKSVRVRKVEEGTDIASPADVRAFTEGMPDRMAIAVPLAAWCALRLGEVLGLQRGDLEHLDAPERAVLHVRRQWNTKAAPPEYTDPKAGSVRTVAIPASLVPAIRAHLERFTGPGAKAPLIPGQDPAKPLSQTAFDSAWRKARAGVRPGFRFHALRHTGLTLFAQQGATLTELMSRGGHKSADVALRYQHAAAERDRALTDRLNEMIGE